ncbi:MAG TPA: glycosyltransferase family 2 protein [Fibrobacteria bacterium]|nr:glycosyltransferase family 2 protein [Fibrobacteria bacterium]
MPSEPAMAQGRKHTRPDSQPPPLVSLGLPVYNGSNFLRPALDSILAQTYRHWELILSDNGSTDATESICREYAAREPRIRYYREAVNRGATWNFNRVFDLATGPLFRWTAHDDVCAPELLERCVAVMQSRPEVVLCHPRTRIIDAHGEVVCDYGTRLRTDSPSPGRRFHDLICVDHACFPIFGVVRTRLLRRANPMGDYVGTDRNLLAELSLHGPFHEIPEFLFLRRDHPGTSTRQYPSAKERLVWFGAHGTGGQHPTLRRGLEYWHSIARAPLGPGDRLACVGILGKWVSMRIRSVLGRNLNLPGLGGAYQPAALSQAAASPVSPAASSMYLTLKRALALTLSQL